MTVRIEQIFAERNEMEKLLRRLVKEKSYSLEMCEYLVDPEIIDEAEFLIDMIDIARKKKVE